MKPGECSESALDLIKGPRATQLQRSVASDRHSTKPPPAFEILLCLGQTLAQRDKVTHTYIIAEREVDVWLTAATFAYR